MSLTYDPSAIRYASTQEAYGCTWTLNKIEDDGAQVWKNAKGQEAFVPKICTPVWKPLNVDQASDQLSTVKRVPISDGRKQHQTSIHTNVTIINRFNANVVDSCSWDRVLTNEEVTKIFNEGCDAVPGGKRVISAAGNSLGVQGVKKKLRLTAHKGDEILTRDKRHLRFDGEKWRPF